MRLDLPLLLTLGSVGWGLPALAHGVVLEHRLVESIEITARYDTGEPMANAQVLVYAPDNPTEAWQQGTTDAQGRFSFVPPGDRPGTWEVMVRQAGHGGVVTVPVESAIAATDAPGTDSTATAAAAPEEPVTTPSARSALVPNTSLSPAQQAITIGAVIWGFVGTALFFARGKR